MVVSHRDRIVTAGRAMFALGTVAFAVLLLWQPLLFRFSRRGGTSCTQISVVLGFTFDNATCVAACSECTSPSWAHVTGNWPDNNQLKAYAASFSAFGWLGTVSALAAMVAGLVTSAHRCGEEKRRAAFARNPLTNPLLVGDTAISAASAAARDPPPVAERVLFASALGCFVFDTLAILLFAVFQTEAFSNIYHDGTWGPSAFGLLVGCGLRWVSCVVIRLSRVLSLCLGHAEQSPAAAIARSDPESNRGSGVVVVAGGPLPVFAAAADPRGSSADPSVANSYFPSPHRSQRNSVTPGDVSPPATAASPSTSTAPSARLPKPPSASSLSPAARSPTAPNANYTGPKLPPPRSSLEAVAPSPPLQHARPSRLMRVVSAIEHHLLTSVVKAMAASIAQRPLAPNEDVDVFVSFVAFDREIVLPKAPWVPSSTTPSTSSLSASVNAAPSSVPSSALYLIPDDDSIMLRLEQWAGGVEPSKRGSSDAATSSSSSARIAEVLCSLEGLCRRGGPTCTYKAIATAIDIANQGKRVKVFPQQQMDPSAASSAATSVVTASPSLTVTEATSIVVVADGEDSGGRESEIVSVLEEFLAPAKPTFPPCLRSAHFLGLDAGSDGAASDDGRLRQVARLANGHFTACRQPGDDHAVSTAWAEMSRSVADSWASHALSKPLGPFFTRHAFHLVLAVDVTDSMSKVE